MNEITAPVTTSAIESVLIDGDLSKLTAPQRVQYYRATCDSLGLNYLTKPFAYIRLNGKLTLYALKDCTEQLRKRDGVSIVDMKTQLMEGVFIVTAYAETASGKKDVATGAVTIQGLKGEALANAYMKAETKAKRRVTLSVCGLGMTDEGEVETIPDAKKIDVDMETGELIQSESDIEHQRKFLDEIASQRQEFVEEIKIAQSIDELKNSYGKAYRLHKGNLDIMKDITNLKDQRVSEIKALEACIDMPNDPLPVFEEDGA